MASMSSMPLIINDRLTIPEDEISYVASRSAGPGGQHVNKVNSRVTLVFDLQGSVSLTEAQKERLRERLATRISKAGELRVSAQRERSQVLNRQRAREVFCDLVRQALERQTPRRPTRVPKSSKRRRLTDKKRRGEVKKGRQGRYDET